MDIQNKLEKLLSEAESKSIKHKESEESDKAEAEKLTDEVESKLLKQKEHGARSFLTGGFLVGLFLLITLAGIYVIYHNNAVIEMAGSAKEKGLDLSPETFKLLSFETIFSLIMNSFGTGLGFIIGYYFKEKQK